MRPQGVGRLGPGHDSRPVPRCFQFTLSNLRDNGPRRFDLFDSEFPACSRRIALTQLVRELEFAIG